MQIGIKKLAEQTAIYGLSSVIGRLLNYLLVPLYTRIFLPEVYGIVTEWYAYVAFLIIIFTYGMETGFFRFAESENNLKKVYGTSILSLFFTSLIFIVLTILFAQPIADLLKYSYHKEYIIWFAIIVGIDAFTAIPFAKLRHQNKAKKFVTIKLLNIGVNIGLNLFFLILCPKVIANNPESVLNYIYSPHIGVGYVFLSNLIASIITLILLSTEIFNVKISFDYPLLKKILMYSFPLLIAGLAGMVNETLDRILLKHLLPETVNVMEQIGIYGANYKVSILMLIFIQAFRFAAEPFFFSQYKEKNSKQMYADVMKYFVIFSLFIFLGVMMYIDIVKHFIGQQYHSGIKIVPILLLANLFLGIIFNLSIWYKLNNLTRFGAYIAIFGATITVLLNIWLIPKIGYFGSAWATFFCYLSMMIVSFFWGRKYYPVNYNLKRILSYIALALILFFISKYIVVESYVLTLLINTTLLLIFAGVVFYKEKIMVQLKSKN